MWIIVVAMLMILTTAGLGSSPPDISIPDSAATTVEPSAVVEPPPVTINANNQTSLLVEALRTPNAIIYVENNVELDLSELQSIPIYPGVQLIGKRIPGTPGPRLYTTKFPKRLFHLWCADNVRVTGLRIDGGEMGVAGSDTDSSIGIVIESSWNVEIADNEIYGWRGAAVEVRDDQNRISRMQNAMTVRIHDNYIHHNQHYEGHGYGVNVSNGAYALIEKNVFDWNRHAVTSDGLPGSGYLAYRNLVLEHGGLHQHIVFDWYTHMFDMHGTEKCWGVPDSCGPAGEYLDISYNAFLYTSDNAFKLRGTPAIRADVAHNVFKHRAIWDRITPYEITPGALAQTESGLKQWDNKVDVDESDNYVLCDFDADGVNDRFFATGASWWYSSGGTGHWVYLNTSTKKLSALTLGYFDDDGKCDVKAGSTISSGGTGPWRALLGGILWQNTSGQLAVWSIQRGTIVGETYPGIEDASWQVRGTGDFNGDNHSDILWQNTSGQVAIWYMSRGTQVGVAYPGGRVSADWRIKAVGDFDGDGRADILWRNNDGQLAIWFKGNPRDKLFPVVYPGYDGVPQPVPLYWQIAGVGDFNGDGRSDILWRKINGQVGIWYMTAGTRTGESYPGGADPTSMWTTQGVGDFDSDGRSDILWRHGSGQLKIWLGGDATRAVYPSYYNKGGLVDLSWQVQGLADYNIDGRTDILWRHTEGAVAIWFLAGGQFLGDAYPRTVDASWQIKGVLSHPK
jgi:FG-GAP-like repeat/Right handed beta helix region